MRETEREKQRESERDGKQMVTREDEDTGREIRIVLEERRVGSLGTGRCIVTSKYLTGSRDNTGTP